MKQSCLLWDLSEERSMATEQELVRKLRGHTDAVLCCFAARSSPHLLISSSEDGSACLFDIRSKTCSQRLQQVFCGKAVVSVHLNPGNEAVLYAAAGASVYTLDLRLGPSGAELHKYQFSKDEINQVVVNTKATFLAAADDIGEVKVIDLASHKLSKNLRGAHESICSSVQFHPQKPWEVLSGGLDSRIFKWDFSRGRPLKEINLTLSTEATAQICNPPFIHALAVPEGEFSGKVGRLMVAARGDGAVDVFDLHFKGDVLPDYRGTKKNREKPVSDTTAVSKEGSFHWDLPGRLCHLPSGIGGHRSAVSTVTFAKFGVPGQYIVSGGNDYSVKLWDWAKSGPRDDATRSNPSGGENALVLSIEHSKKVNWCTTTEAASENLVVADTSKALSVYSIR